MFGRCAAPTLSVVVVVLALAAQFPIVGIGYAAEQEDAVPRQAIFDFDPIAPKGNSIAPVKPGARESKPARYVTLMIGGDLGFGGSRQPVAAKAGVRKGRRIAYADLTRRLQPILKGI